MKRKCATQVLNSIAFMLYTIPTATCEDTYYQTTIICHLASHSPAHPSRLTGAYMILRMCECITILWATQGRSLWNRETRSDKGLYSLRQTCSYLASIYHILCINDADQRGLDVTKRVNVSQNKTQVVERLVSLSVDALQ